MKNNEPEIMGTTKNILKKFVSFCTKRLYFIFALFFVNFLYTYLIMKFVESPKVEYFVGMFFNISFYPMIMIFVMYIVNLFYAGKKDPDFQDVMRDGKEFFQPLALYYIGILLVRNIMPMQLGIFVMVLLVKLAFVDQLIYYRNYTVTEAVKASWRMVSLRLFFVLFIGMFIGINIMNSIGQYLYMSGDSGAMFSLVLNILVFVLIKFLTTIFYRELIKIDFYSSKI